MTLQLCYFEGVSDKVGIRELRQDLSRYIRRVRAGERLVVTERGRSVAVLSPWAEEGDIVDRLVAEGRMRRGSGGLLAVRALDRVISRAGSEALAQERAERT
jgi:prevent-host-death family protein